MKIVYLPATRSDIAWLRDYCSRIFPEGHTRARQHFKATEKLLSENPLFGRVVEAEGVRELVIPKTPFSFLYRIRQERIEVLRVWDGRADRGILDFD